MSDDLERFVQAQQGGAFDAALAELRRGRKTGHWIWFVFPQLRGLGHSTMATWYGIASLDEARDYVAHPVLGERLRTCASTLLAMQGRSAEEILGPLDAMKVRSSMTLFHRADSTEPRFREVLIRYYGGTPDPMTDDLLALG